MKASFWIIIIESVILVGVIMAMIIVVQATMIDKSDLLIRCQKAESAIVEARAATKRRDKNLEAISTAAAFKNYKAIVQELDKWSETRKIEEEAKKREQ